MTTAEKDYNVYVTRLQTRFNRKHPESKVSKPDVRAAYQAIVTNLVFPSEEEMTKVIERLEAQIAEVQESGLTISEPEIIEITPDNSPDAWEILQPSEEPVELEAPVEPEASNASALAKPEETKPTAPGASIPQDEVKGMVAQVFSNQPAEFTNQVTEYALQHSFENVRQIQEFLEQLRGMEFNLLVQTLTDHASRRGSMLTVLNEVLDGQRQKDQENRTNFFGSFHSRLNQFQQEMESKLSKQSI